MKNTKLFFSIGIGIVMVLTTIGILSIVSTPEFYAKRNFIKQMKQTEKTIEKISIESDKQQTFESIDSLKNVLLQSVIDFKECHVVYLTIVGDESELNEYYVRIWGINTKFQLEMISLELKHLGLSIDKLEEEWEENN